MNALFQKKWIVLLICICFTLGLWLFGASVTIKSAKIVAIQDNVLSPWSGEVAEIFVKEGDFVQKDKPLFRMDTASEKRYLDVARALLQNLSKEQEAFGQGSLEGMKKNIDALSETLLSTRKAEDHARESFTAQNIAHTQKLLALRAIDAKQYEYSNQKDFLALREGAQKEERAAFLAMEEAQKKLTEQHDARAEASVSLQKAQKLYEKALQWQNSPQKQVFFLEAFEALRQQEAFARKAVQDTEKKLAQALVLAPFDGRIEGLFIKPAMYAEGEQFLVSIQAVLPPNIWIEATCSPEIAKKLAEDGKAIIRFLDEKKQTKGGQITKIDIGPNTATVRVDFVDFGLEDIGLLQHTGEIELLLSTFALKL